MRLQGKNAMITGGARGQGDAEARAFIKAGAKVLITDVEEKDGTALAKELGENAFFLKHDVAEDKDWLAAIKQAMDKLGGLDVLVNNAGIYEPGSIADTSVEDFERQVRINQLGTFLGMKHAAPVMGKGGSIINISSVAGMEGFPGACAYVGTKWAVRGMTKTAAKEFGEQGIRVNSIHPGFIDTDMLDANDDEANAQGKEDTPLKRFGTAEEIANLAVFLASDDSAFISGAEIAIDGGYSA